MDTARIRTAKSLPGLRRLLGLSITVAVCSGPAGLAAAEPWVGTWSCAPQLTEPSNLPPLPLAQSTLRQFVHVTLGGKVLRVRFSNDYGTSPVTVDAAHVALSAGAGSAGHGEIDPLTDKPLSFGGIPSVTLPPGGTAVSDPLDFNLPPLTSLAVSARLGDASATSVNGHPGSRTTSFIQPGNALSDASLPTAATTPHWYLLTGVEVLADARSKAIVILGDSLTDGRGSTTDRNDRWPDQLARRLAANPSTAHVAVLNLGIGGNGVFGGLGPPASARFDRDVLGQSGVAFLILFVGINDIGAGASATSLTEAYARFAHRARSRQLRIYGATLTPFRGHAYDTPAHEATRQAVNAWIRTNTTFDAVLDFDAAVRNPAAPARLLPAFDSGDGLHLNPAGYRALADAIELALFAERPPNP